MASEPAEMEEAEATLLEMHGDGNHYGTSIGLVKNTIFTVKGPDTVG